MNGLLLQAITTKEASMKVYPDHLSEEDRKVINEREAVDLIASGYEWTCPACEWYNREIETLTLVQCEGCNGIFKVGEANHAHG